MSKENLETKLQRALDTMLSLEAEVIALTRRLADQKELLSVQDKDLHTLVEVARLEAQKDIVSFPGVKDIWQDIMRQKQRLETTRGIVAAIEADLRRKRNFLETAVNDSQKLKDELKSYGEIVPWKP